MKSKAQKSLISLLAVPAGKTTALSDAHGSYIIGGIIALLILCYLIFTLLKPEKF
jgi:K+-transporting ATPase KdpF subunit